MAERAAAAWNDRCRKYTEEPSLRDDPYVYMVHEWAWLHHEPAVEAHEHGDDVTALANAKVVVRLKEAIGPTARKRGIPEPKNDCMSPELLLFLPFGDEAARLLEDGARRVKTPPVKRVLEVGLGKFPDQAQRIAALVRDLEVVQADESWGSSDYYFGESIDGSPVIQALIKEGDAAVEPFLQCLANDRRLTRTVGYYNYGGEFYSRAQLYAVDDAAFVVLQQVLKSESFGPLTVEGYKTHLDMKKRREVADEVRRFWNRNKGRTQEEIWLSVLEDPGMTPAEWLKAAQAIVSRVSRNEAIFPSDDGGVPPEDPDNLSRPMAGEPLRVKYHRRLVEAIARRSDEMARMARLVSFDDRYGRAGQRMCEACGMALCLAEWDRKAAMPVIRRRFDNCRPYTGYPAFYQCAGATLALLAEAGIQAGDQRIIDTYAAWLRSIPKDRGRRRKSPRRPCSPPSSAAPPRQPQTCRTCPLDVSCRRIGLEPGTSVDPSRRAISGITPVGGPRVPLRHQAKTRGVVADRPSRLRPPRDGGYDRDQRRGQPDSEWRPFPLCTRRGLAGVQRGARPARG